MKRLSVSPAQVSRLASSACIPPYPCRQRCYVGWVTSITRQTSANFDNGRALSNQLLGSFEHADDLLRRVPG